MPETLIEYYKLQPYLDILTSAEYDVLKIKESIEAFAKAFSDEKAIKTSLFEHTAIA